MGQSFPDNLGQIAAEHHLSDLDFRCTSQEPLPGLEGEVLVQHLNSPQSHYVYCASNLPYPAPSNTVLLHDRTLCHINEGMNVLYADGRVDFLKKSAAIALLKQLDAGNNPPRSP